MEHLDESPTRASTRRPRAAWTVAAAALGAGLALAVGGCRSLPKPALEQRLLALEKNAPARAAGLTRASLELELDGERRTLELTYLRAGPGPDTPPGTWPVVLVHGTPSTLFTWTPLIFGGQDFAGLAAGRTVVALEVAGHGVARGSAAPYDFDRCARFVVAAIRALGLGPVHLVGQSYGGEFAWRAALLAPELVHSLVLMDSSGYPRPDDGWLPEEVAMRENPLAKIGWWLNSRERIEGALAPHFRAVPPGVAEEFFLVCGNSHNWAAMVDLARDENGTAAGRLPDVAAPTLVLWGADDVAYPPDAYAARFAADIPGAELAVLPGTGHYPHEERPAVVARELERFFAVYER